MNVNPATAKHVHEHAGKKFYFCCAGCVEKFKANPQGYLNKPVHPDQALSFWGWPPRPLHICHPERSLRFAIAKRRRRRGTLSLTLATPAYVCPMCPEVRESKPGACPSCGMALEPDVPLAATTHRIHLPHAPPNRAAPSLVRAPSAAWPSNRAPSPPSQEENPELRDMTRRFWVGVVLTAPLLAVAMGTHDLAVPHDDNPCTGSACRQQSALARIRSRHPGRPLVRPAHSSSASGRRSSTAAPTCSP